MQKKIGLLMSLFAGIMLNFSNVSADSVEDVSQRTICPDTRPMMCTMDYTPVCGTSDDGSTKTYSNGCGACSNPKVVSYVPQACPEHILSSEELKQLFSGNTYVAVIPSRKLEMTVYVDPDGNMRGMQNGHKFTSKWKVSENDEICVSYKDKMSCRTVIEEEGVYKKFKVNEKGEKVVLVIYQSFSKGNVHSY